MASSRAPGTETMDIVCGTLQAKLLTEDWLFLDMLITIVNTMIIYVNILLKSESTRTHFR